MTSTIELNGMQHTAAYSPHDRRIVIAGPGTGKTETLAAAAVNEAELYGDERVAVITYTNAAAAELERRLQDRRLGFIGTLHAFMLKAAGGWHRLVGLPSRLTVLSNDQRAARLEAVQDELGMKLTTAELDEALQDLVPNLMKDAFRTPSSRAALAVKAYRAQALKWGTLDFDQVLHYGFRAAQAANDRKEWPFSSLLVDEGQDATAFEWWLFSVGIPAKRRFVIGDPRQSIFGWRGGSPAGMLSAAKSDSWEAHALWDGYRCAPNIIRAANGLRVEAGIHVILLSRVEEQGAVGCRTCADEHDEAAWVADMVKREMAFHDVAVLARTRKVAARVAEELALREIEHKVGDERPERPADWDTAKLLLAVLAQPENDDAVFHYLTHKHGKDYAVEARLKAALAGKSLNAHLESKFGNGEQITDADLLRHGLSERARDEIWSVYNPSMTLNEALIELERGRPKLLAVKPGVYCGTAHSAKGREWGCVFVVGCEEGLWPMDKRDTDMDEERRLMFVAATRARDRLVLTWAQERRDFKGVPERRDVSRFVAEMGLQEVAL